MNAGFLAGKARVVLAALAGLGIVAFAAGLIGGSERLWPGYLVAVVYYLTLALGAMAFVAIHHVANAAWWMPMRRIPEAMIAWLPIGGALLLVTLLGAGSLYHWTHEGAIPATSAMAFKSSWLTLPGFATRMVAILALWVALGYALRRESLWQDRYAGLAATRRSRALSATFLVVLALTVTVASVDWLMSLQWEFVSTLYGWYTFSGLFVSAMAAVALIVLWLRRRGILHAVTDDHLHSLGKMIFAFATFWAYLWYCQYMLVYYAGLPEETLYYTQRAGVALGGEAFLVCLVLGWGVPFVLLLGRGAKRSPVFLVAASVSVLLGHWLDIYSVVLPVTAGSLVPGVVDTGIFVGVSAAFLLLVDRAMARRALIPHNDPYLGEALGHHHVLQAHRVNGTGRAPEKVRADTEEVEA
jgi:hypothetical protein